MSPSDPETPGDETVVSSPGSSPPRPAETTRPSGGTIPVGAVISHTYRIESLLAIGGMGEVYRAEHLFNQRIYALKMIKPEFASDDRIIALFRREAGILESIRNPVIVGYSGLVLDENNHPFIVMEYVDGPSLADLIGKRTFSVADVRLLRDKLASALDETHRRGIVHRDISPDNIVLQDGQIDQPRIIDFGIARQEAAATTLIGDGFAGKYRYASPEQLGAHGGRVDGRSDVYSLGLVLAAIARGKPLDMGTTPTEVLSKRATVPGLTGVPEEVWPDLTAMLHPDPADRPERAGDLIGMGEQGHGAAPDRRAGDRTAHGGRGGGRGKVIAITAGVLLLAGGGGAGYVAWQGGFGSELPPVTPPDAPMSDGTPDVPPVSLPVNPPVNPPTTPAYDSTGDATADSIVSALSPRPAPNTAPVADTAPDAGHRNPIADTATSRRHRTRR